MLRVFAVVLCFSCAAPGHSLTVVDMFAKVVNLCQQKSNVSLLYCVKERSLIALDHVYRSKNDISIVPNFVSLSRNDGGADERSAKILPEGLLDEGRQNKSSVLDHLIVGRLYDFIESRAISIKVPITSLDFLNLLPESEEDKVEGRGQRGKKDKGAGMLAMGAMMAGTMITMKLAAVAAIAGKALMASMMAIMLAGIAALSKKSHTHGSTYEVINVPSHGHHARRSLAETAAYSDLAHRPESAHRSESTYGHRPEPTSNESSYEIDVN